MSVSALLTVAALVLYLAAMFAFASTPPGRQEAATPGGGGSSAQQPRPRWSRPLLYGGIAFQFVALGAWCVSTHRSPFASEYGTLSVMAWAMAIAIAVLDFRVRLPAVDSVALGIGCAVLFAAVVEEHGPIAATPVLSGRLVSIHVIAILASFGLMALAFGCALLYVVQDRHLKQRRSVPLLRRLPPLETLDRLAYTSIAYALPLLTVGLVFGIVRALAPGVQGPPRAWLEDPHTVVSMFTWCLYVAYLMARTAGGWRGVRLQYILLAGMLVAFTLYVVPTSTHRFS